MPGFFNKMGTYMAGAGAAGMAAMAKNPALRRTVVGAAMGGAYGAVSDDTSVLGGMAMGAAAGRYGGAGFNRIATGRAYGFGTSAKRFGMAMAARARLDARGARMAANQGYGKFRSMFR